MPSGSPRAWPCLMYHEVEDDAERPGYFGVSASTFGRHLDRCRELQHSACTLESRLVGATTGVPLTFDDGHVGCHRHALPALVGRGMAATFFVVTDWVGRPGRVTWEQLQEMAGAGMSIQSHTRSHPFLSELTPRVVEEELRRSRETLEDRLGHAVTTLSLPNGDAPRGWRLEDFSRVGYRWVATSRWRLNVSGDDSRGAFIDRLTVRRDTPPSRVASMIQSDAAGLWAEGARLAALRAIRAAIGPSTYATLRRGLLRRLRPADAP